MKKPFLKRETPQRRVSAGFQIVKKVPRGVRRRSGE